MALDTFKSVPHLLEQFLGTVGVASVTVAVPTLAAAEAGEAANATVTGAKIGDLVFAAPTAALPTNAAFAGAFVVAADTVSYSFTNVGAAAVTGANRTFTTYVIHRS